MKKIKYLFVLLITLFSCSNDDDSSSETTYEKWVLTQMSGNLHNSQTSGDEMSWQEFYLLKSDGTFKKSRATNGVIVEAFGSYNFIDSLDRLHIELIFSTESDIIGSCNSELKEEMYYESENTFYSTWNSCDGPGLKYEKID